MLDDKVRLKIARFSKSLTLTNYRLKVGKKNIEQEDLFKTFIDWCHKCLTVNDMQEVLDMYKSEPHTLLCQLCVYCDVTYKNFKPIPKLPEKVDKEQKIKDDIESMYNAHKSFF